MDAGQYIQGFYIPNLRKLADEVMKVLDISAPVSIIPLRMKTMDAVGYAERKGDKYTVFIDTEILKKDELSDPVISLFIHEIWHVKQMETGRLAINSAETVVLWEGVHYTMATIKHEHRPWEIEARMKEAEYLDEVKKLVVKYY